MSAALWSARVRNLPFFNLSSISDQSFDNILMGKIQMTRQLGWRSDFNKLIKNSRNDKFKDQTDDQPGTRSQRQQ